MKEVVRPSTYPATGRSGPGFRAPARESPRGAVWLSPLNRLEAYRSGAARRSRTCAASASPFSSTRANTISASTTSSRRPPPERRSLVDGAIVGLLFHSTGGERFERRSERGGGEPAGWRCRFRSTAPGTPQGSSVHLPPACRRTPPSSSDPRPPSPSGTGFCRMASGASAHRPHNVAPRRTAGDPHCAHRSRFVSGAGRGRTTSPSAQRGGFSRPRRGLSAAKSTTDS